MENLTDKAAAFEKATSTIQKKPWAALIVVLIFYTVGCYYVIKSQFESQIDYLINENKRVNNRYDHLTTELLIKNKVIDKQDEVIKIADSALIEIKK